MYVIWRKRKREHYDGFWSGVKIGDVRLTPIIVQSRRVNGNPKQEHIACLPSIIESQINDKSAVWFWTAVEEQLGRLTNRISQDDMKKIRAALDKVVHQPEPEFAETLKDGAAAHREIMVAALSPRSEWERDANKQMLEQARERAKSEELARVGNLKLLAQSLAEASVTIEGRANEEGHLFGSVNVAQIAAAFKGKGLPVDEKQIRLEHPLKEIGVFDVAVHLHADVEAVTKVWVVQAKPE